jgi:hypothetical protein
VVIEHTLPGPATLLPHQVWPRVIKQRRRVAIRKLFETAGVELPYLSDPFIACVVGVLMPKRKYQ